MIHIAKSPQLDFLFQHGNGLPTPLPLIFDARGNFCWEINSYLTKYGGGFNSYGARPAPKTVLSQAETLNVFQEYIDHRQLTIYDVDDEILYDYFNYNRHVRNANSTTIKRNIRRVLSLLEHIQKENTHRNLITTDPASSGFRVNAIEEHYNFSKRKSIRFLNHACIEDLRDTPTVPITFIKNNQLRAWHDAIADYTSNSYVTDRWYTLTTLLEHTGSRIEETLNIPASSILDAYKKNGPVRNIPVLKGKYRGCSRTVLLPRAELQEIYKFVVKTHSKFPHSIVHDKIFVSETTGHPLSRSTFNSYYRLVIKASKHVDLLTGISYHNFRHRYFTLLVAKNISRLSKLSKAHVLDIALSIARNDSYHASKNTLSTYVHLSQDPEIQGILQEEQIATTTIEEIQHIINGSDDRTSDEKLASIKAILQIKD